MTPYDTMSCKQSEKTTLKRDTEEVLLKLAKSSCRGTHNIRAHVLHNMSTNVVCTPKRAGKRTHTRRLKARETKYMPLETLTPMALEIDRRELTNRVNRDEVWARYPLWCVRQSPP